MISDNITAGAVVNHRYRDATAVAIAIAIAVAIVRLWYFHMAIIRFSWQLRMFGAQFIIGFSIGGKIGKSEHTQQQQKTINSMHHLCGNKQTPITITSAIFRFRTNLTYLLGVDKLQV